MGRPRGEAVCECVKIGRVRAGGGGREGRVEGRVSNGTVLHPNDLLQVQPLNYAAVRENPAGLDVTA